MVQTYNKLIRDKVPQIIEDSGHLASLRVLTENEFDQALQDKLREEVAEFIESKEVEELDDILEVVYCLADRVGHTPESIEHLRSKKAAQKGGFLERIFLIETEEEAF